MTGHALGATDGFNFLLQNDDGAASAARQAVTGARVWFEIGFEA